MRTLLRLSNLSHLACIGVLACFAPAHADYPERPVRLIVPFPPGGGTEPISRLLAQKLSESLGQQFVIDNRPGAGTTIGVELAARATPDGYTLLLGSIANAISATLYRKVNFDLSRDFAPVTLLATTTGVLAVHPTLPVKTVKDFIALARSRPGEIAYASAGSGTPTHLQAELFSYLTQIKMNHVPYKGGAPAVLAVLSGEAALSFAALPSAISQIRAGKLRALAVTTAQRSPSTPDIPTLRESGVPGYEAETWYGLVASARTPANIITRLHTESHKALSTAQSRKRLDAMGMQVRLSTPAEYAAFTQSEIEKWRNVIKTAAIRAD